MTNFIQELTWRGMLHNVMPGTEDQLNQELTTAYLGIDPTADSLHIGHLVGIMMLKHLQNAGHKPVALLGGATGMIGDPSGKSQERNLLSEQELRYNQEAIRKQLSKFLDFDSDAPNKAILVNNYDWMSTFSFLDFIRDIGKHITVNYMMAKDSVKKRIASEEEGGAEGMSFTEFTYQLVQGYDFLHLYKTHGCKLQLGGSDQWGNITTGTEMIRRMEGGKAYAVTCPLLTKSDGGKFGKTEKGNIWLDAEKTSPYTFYQFWINADDKDAERFIKIFTTFTHEHIAELIAKHAEAPHFRLLQKTLAQELTTLVHGEERFNFAIEASQILFGKGTKETLEKLSDADFNAIFADVPQYQVEKSKFDAGVPVLDLLAVETDMLKSKAEARRLVQGNGLSINQEKYSNVEGLITKDQLLNGKYLLIKNGKKYSVITILES